MIETVGHDDTRPNDVEFLDVGPTGDEHDALVSHGWPPWLRLVVLLAAVLAAVVTVVTVHENSKPSVSPTARGLPTPRSTHTAPGPSPPRAAPQSAAAPVTVTELGPAFLGVRGHWELFGRGDGVVVRIQFAAGRITRTTIPALRSSGPVSFVAAADRAIIRPIDYVSGYVVPDGLPAREMSARLSQGGPVFPGPDLRHVWVQFGDNNAAGMVLHDVDGRPTATSSIAVPANDSSLDATADGNGYLLFTGIGGVYDARPTGLHRVTTGALLAVGPTGWLVTECDNQDHCATVVIDRANSSRHVVPLAIASHGLPGRISPDGKTAAVFTLDSTGTPTLNLLDLVSGTKRPIDASIDQAPAAGTLAWSPDSKWLFAVGATGNLVVIDAHTATGGTLSTPLPPLSQLAIRDTATN